MRKRSTDGAPFEAPTLLKFAITKLKWTILFSLVVNILALTLPLYMLQVYDRVISSKSLETLAVLTVFAVTLLAFGSYFETIRSKINASAALGLERDLQEKVFDRIFMGSNRPSSFTAVETLGHIQKVKGTISAHSFNALLDIPWSIPFFLLIFAMHPYLGLIGLAGAVCLVLVAVYTERKSNPLLGETRHGNNQTTKDIAAIPACYDAANSMNLLPALKEEWLSKNSSNASSQYALSHFLQRVTTGSRLIRQVIQVLILGTGASLAIDQQITPGSMIAASIILGRALSPFEQGIGNWRNLKEAGRSLGVLNRVLGESRPLPEHPKVRRVEGNLAVENIYVALHSTKPPILNNISFSLNKGEFLIVTGFNGAGKTTLLRAIIGTAPLMRGNVLLDNVPVSGWNAEQFGRNVGYLPQDLQLLPKTISANIQRLGVDADEDMVAAAKRTGVHEEILKLPFGYQTTIEQEQHTLSTGLRQRIALTRSIFRSPRLVVLDEPEANLDEHGLRALMHCIKSLKEDGVTVVVASHRLGLLPLADKVLTLKEGYLQSFSEAENMRQELRQIHQKASVGAV